MHVLERFFSAFAQRDWATMGACYHAGARFSDPVFPHLDEAEVRAMWRMLLTGGTDLRISHMLLKADERSGEVRWEAWYTFGKTKRPVHNIITSRFTIENGLILVQRDHFDFWRWSRQALGLPGIFFGWSPWLRGKVRYTAKGRLQHAMTPRAS